MDQPNIEIFSSIKGISAASGLFLTGDLLYVIGDNSSYLYEYHLTAKRLNKIPLLAGLNLQEQIPKIAKPDFEVLCHYNNTLYVLGSGSTALRNRMISYHLGTKKTTAYDLSPLYSAMKKAHAIDDSNLNIEGAIFNGQQWLLFNRGNGSEMKNGIFIIKDPDLTQAKSADFISLSSFGENTQLASFTDAVLYQDQIYFIAAAEDTTSTYHDGKILGSYVGSLALSTLKLNYIRQIASDQKFEGITFFRQHNSKLEFLMCEDADAETSDAIIYKLIL